MTGRLRLPALRDSYGVTGFAVCLIIAAVAVVLVVVVVAGSAAGDRLSCHRAGTVSGHPVRWDLITGCWIDPGTGWVPLDQWRSVDVTR